MMKNDRTHESSKTSGVSVRMGHRHTSCIKARCFELMLELLFQVVHLQNVDDATKVSFAMWSTSTHTATKQFEERATITLGIVVHLIHQCSQVVGVDDSFVITRRTNSWTILKKKKTAK